MNQLPSEIFVLWSVSFLIKLSCKKLPPSLVKCVFFCFNVPPSGQNVQRLFKFLLFEFSMRRKVGHQNLILLFSIPSGANSFVCRVKFNSRLWVPLVRQCHSADSTTCTAATNFRQRRCLSQSTGTLPHVVKIALPKFKDLLHKKIVVGSYRPRTVLYPGALTRLQIEVFVCFRLFR